jgi:hypothetical protein
MEKALYFLQMETYIKVNSKMAEGMDMAIIQPTVLNTKATGWMII